MLGHKHGCVLQTPNELRKGLQTIPVGPPNHMQYVSYIYAKLMKVWVQKQNKETKEGCVAYWGKYIPSRAFITNCITEELICHTITVVDMMFFVIIYHATRW